MTPDPRYLRPSRRPQPAEAPAIRPGWIATMTAGGVLAAGGAGLGFLAMAHGWSGQGVLAALAGVGCWVAGVVVIGREVTES